MRTLFTPSRREQPQPQPRSPHHSESTPPSALRRTPRNESSSQRRRVVVRSASSSPLQSSPERREPLDVDDGDADLVSSSFNLSDSNGRATSVASSAKSYASTLHREVVPLGTMSIRPASGSGDAIRCVTAVPSGVVWTGERGGWIRTRDSSTGEIAPLRHNRAYVDQHDNVEINVLVYVAKTDEVWAGRSDGALFMYSISDGQETHSIRPHDSAILCGALLSDGVRVVTGGADWKINVWDVVRRRHLGMLSGHANAVRCLVPLPLDCPTGGGFLSGSDDTTLVRWRQNASAERAGVYDGHTRGVLCATHTGIHVWSGGEDGSVRLFDLVTFAPIVVLKLHTVPVCSLLFVEGDFKVWSVARDGVMALWDPVDYSLIDTMSAINQPDIGRSSDSPTSTRLNVPRVTAVLPVARCSVWRLWTCASDGSIDVRLSLGADDEVVESDIHKRYCDKCDELEAAETALARLRAEHSLCRDDDDHNNDCNGVSDELRAECGRLQDELEDARRQLSEQRIIMSPPRRDPDPVLVTSAAFYERATVQLAAYAFDLLEDSEFAARCTMQMCEEHTRRVVLATHLDQLSLVEGSSVLKCELKYAEVRREELVALRSSLDQAMEEKDRLRASVSDLHEQLGRRDEELQSLYVAREALQEELQHKTAEVEAAVRNARYDAEQHISDLETTLVDVRAELTHLSSTLLRTQSQYTNKCNECVTLQDDADAERNRLLEELKNAQSRAARQKSECQSAQESLHDVREELQHVQDELCSVKAKYVDKCSEAHHDTERSAEEILGLRKLVAELRGEIAGKTSAYLDASHQSELARGDFERKEEEVRALKYDLDAANNEVHALREANTRAQEGWEERCRDLTQELEQMRQEHATHAAAWDRQRQDLAREVQTERDEARQARQDAEKVRRDAELHRAETDAKALREQSVAQAELLAAHRTERQLLDRFKALQDELDDTKTTTRRLASERDDLAERVSALDRQIRDSHHAAARELRSLREQVAQTSRPNSRAATPTNSVASTTTSAALERDHLVSELRASVLQARDTISSMQSEDLERRRHIRQLEVELQRRRDEASAEINSSAEVESLRRELSRVTSKLHIAEDELAAMVVRQQQQQQPQQNYNNTNTSSRQQSPVRSSQRGGMMLSLASPTMSTTNNNNATPSNHYQGLPVGRTTANGSSGSALFSEHRVLRSPLPSTERNY
eukprot:PhM_4_TR3016/c1_g1_i1/m.89322